MSPIHFHGFEPWTGPRAEYAREELRRPGKQPHDEATKAFLANRATPIQLGLGLMRRSQVSPDRTWINVEDALTWYRKTWDANQPGGSHLPLENRLAYVRDSLILGSDVCAGYYTPNFSFVAFSIVCCPNRFFPDIPCPLPPRQAQGRSENVPELVAAR